MILAYICCKNCSKSYSDSYFNCPKCNCYTPTSKYVKCNSCKTRYSDAYRNCPNCFAINPKYNENLPSDSDYQGLGLVFFYIVVCPFIVFWFLPGLWTMVMDDWLYDSNWQRMERIRETQRQRYINRMECEYYGDC